MERVGLYIVVSINTVYSKFSSYTCKHSIILEYDLGNLKHLSFFLVGVPGSGNTIGAVHVAPQSMVPAFHVHSFVGVRTEKVSLRLDQVRRASSSSVRVEVV